LVFLINKVIMNYPIYLDYCATTPCHPEVVEAMLPWFTQNFGNASSKNHVYGWMAEHAVESAREKVAQLIGAKPKEIIFTSGATEALNLAIKGTFEHESSRSQHFITATTEHKAVLDTFKNLEKKGARVTYLSVDQKGNITSDEILSSINSFTKMICLMHANNETGTIHDLSKCLKEIPKNVIVCSDAVQSVGKIPISLENIHLLAMSAHKLYGPKGIGALYIKHNHDFLKPLRQIDGGGHEKGFRSGTLNVPAIVGFGKAAEIRTQEMTKEGDRLKELRNYFEQKVLEIPGTIQNGNPENRLPHVFNISFENIEGETLLQKLNQKMAVSSGAACSSISTKPSHVLTAMGIDPILAKASVRFSLGRDTTYEQIVWAIQQITDIQRELSYA
jgi:cysteine desulfurase